MGSAGAGPGYDEWTIAMPGELCWSPARLPNLGLTGPAPQRVEMVTRAIDAFVAKGYLVTVMGTHAALLEHGSPDLVDAGIIKTTPGEGAAVAALITEILRLARHVMEESPPEVVVPQLVILDEWNAAAAAVTAFDPNLNRAFVGLVGSLMHRGPDRGLHVILGSASRIPTSMREGLA